jgi:hypothetical protein
MMRLYLIVLLCWTQWSCSHTVESKSHEQVLDKLQSRYNTWQGTHYQIGGLTRKESTVLVLYN